MQFFVILGISWGHVRSHKKFKPNQLAVLTFIGYKQTDKQEYNYIDISFSIILV